MSTVVSRRVQRRQSGVLTVPQITVRPGNWPGRTVFKVVMRTVQATDAGESSLIRVIPLVLRKCGSQSVQKLIDFTQVVARFESG